MVVGQGPDSSLTVVNKWEETSLPLGRAIAHTKPKRIDVYTDGSKAGDGAEALSRGFTILGLVGLFRGLCVCVGGDAVWGGIGASGPYSSTTAEIFCLVKFATFLDTLDASGGQRVVISIGNTEAVQAWEGVGKGNRTGN